MAIYSPTNSAWRNSLNPLRNLNMARVVNLLSASEQGYYADLQWLYKFIEKRDATLKAVKSRRLSAIKALDWTIKVREGVDEKKAAKQKKALEDAYNTVDNLKVAIQFLAGAEFRGFSHLEKHFNADGDVTRLEPVPQWYWCKKYPSTEWLYNAKASQTNMGVAIKPKNFIIREVESPINEIALISYMRKNLSQKDWDAFVETYGIPPLFVEVPAGSGDPEKYQDIAERVIANGRGVLTGGAKMTTVETGMRGSTPFRPHLDYQDEQIVLAATSGLLTTLSKPTGMNSGVSGSHDDAFYTLAKAEALEISEILQQQFDAQILNEQFPDQDVLAYFELAYQEVGEDNNFIPSLKMLKEAGYEVDLAQVKEKTGLNVKPVAPPAEPPAPTPAPEAPAPEEDPKAEAVPSEKKSKNLVKAIKNMLELSDEELQETLANIR